MKRLDRYVMKEMIVPLIAGTIIVALLFVANELMAIFKNLDIRNIPGTAIAKMVLLRTPSFLVMTLPVGMALASALAMGRLSRESEITAMRAAGIPVRRLLIPVGILGVLVSLLNFYLVEQVVPTSLQEHRRLQYELGNIAFRPAFKSNVVVQLDQYVVNIGAVQRREDDGLDLTDIWVMERLGPNEMRIATAPVGEYLDGVWRLTRPIVHQMRAEQVVSFTTEAEMVINEPVRVTDMLIDPVPEEEPAAALWDAIQKQEKVGGNTRFLEIAFYVKYSIPASCLIFAITSALVAVRVSRGGPFVSVLVSFGLVLLYFNVHIISTQIIGRYEWASPIVSAWLPTIIYAVLGLFALRRIE